MANGDILGPVLGAASDAVNIGTGLVNLFTAKKRREEQWKREDNAVQRRAADLEKAGFSRTLAAGGAAQSSDPIRPSAYNTNVGSFEDALTAKAQRGLQKQQTDTGSAQAALIRGQTGLLQAQKENVEADTAVKLANAPKLTADKNYTEGPQTDLARAQEKNYAENTKHIAEQMQNTIETRTGIKFDNQMKELMYNTTAADVAFFGLFGQPYTKDIFRGSLENMAAAGITGFLNALKGVADDALPAVRNALDQIPWGVYIQSGKNAFGAATDYIKDLGKKGINLAENAKTAIYNLFEGAMRK